MRIESTIKSAKLQLLKGLWIAKFDQEKSINELMEAYFMFSEAVGDEQNYFGANCMLEIASTQMRQRDFPSASSSLNHAVETFEHLFGDEHPLMQKYYTSSADLFLYQEDTVSMLSMANKDLEIVEKNNESSDGGQSIFTLDA